MTVSLSPELQKLVEEKVKAGLFPSAEALVNSAVAQLVADDDLESGEMEKLYSKWFMSPIPPKGININYPLNAETKEAFANPSSKGI